MGLATRVQLTFEKRAVSFVFNSLSLYWSLRKRELYTELPFWVSSVQPLNHVWLFATPWTAACQASLSITNSQSFHKLMSIESAMPSNCLILCRPLLFLLGQWATKACRGTLPIHGWPHQNYLVCQSTLVFWVISPVCDEIHLVPVAKLTDGYLGAKLFSSGLMRKFKCNLHFIFNSDMTNI